MVKTEERKPRTMMIRDFKACAVGRVEICDYDRTESYYSGLIEAIPFVYLDCWVGCLSLSYHLELDEDDRCYRLVPFFLIQLHC